MAISRRPGEALEDYVERQIQEAQADGAFDRLSGAGKPLPFVDKPHDPMEWWRRKLERENLALLPDQLAIRREADEVLRAIARLGSEHAVRERLEALNERIRRINRTTWKGPPTSLAPVDVEAAIRRWRESRRGGR